MVLAYVGRQAQVAVARLEAAVGIMAAGDAQSSASQVRDRGSLLAKRVEQRELMQLEIDASGVDVSTSSKPALVASCDFTRENCGSGRFFSCNPCTRKRKHCGGQLVTAQMAVPATGQRRACPPACCLLMSTQVIRMRCACLCKLAKSNANALFLSNLPTPQYSGSTAGSDDVSDSDGCDDACDAAGVTLLHLHAPDEQAFQQLVEQAWRASNGEPSTVHNSAGGPAAGGAVAEDEPCLVVADWWMSHLQHKARRSPLCSRPAAAVPGLLAVPLQRCSVSASSC